MESIWLTPDQVARLERFHFLCMRSILKIPAAYISRISHAEVHELAHQKGLKAGSLAQVYIARKMKYILHLRRHCDSLEFDVLFDHAIKPRTLDQVVTPLRVGHPRAHWPEMTCMQASNRVRHCRHDQAPPLSELNATFYATPEMPKVWQQLGGGINHFAAHYMHYLPETIRLAQQKAAWQRMVGR